MLNQKYISSIKDFDVNLAYDEYAKEVLTREMYPSRAKRKAKVLFDFASNFIKDAKLMADVGGCYGYFLNNFQKLCEKKGVKTEGVVYELGSEYLSKGPGLFPQIRFIHSDKMGDEKFDIVFLCDVLEHVIDYDKFLIEIENISKKYVLVWVPLELTLFRKILIRLKLLPKIKWGQEHPEKHVNFWGEKEIADILKKHFKILKIGYVSGRDMAEGYAKEVSAPHKSAIVRMLYPLVKYIPDYFYIKLIGGNMLLLCETAQKPEKKAHERILIGDCAQCYSGYAKDQNLRYNASSGGAITALLIYALENKLIDGAIVARTSQNNGLMAESFIARTKKEIIAASGSKYCPGSAVPLKDIIALSESERLAVVGLPCQISAVRKFALMNPAVKKKIVLYLGLFCGRRPDSEAVKFFLKKNNIEEKEVEKITYRGLGWPGLVKVLKKSGETAVFPFPLFWTIAGSDFFCAKSCSLCQDCLSESADISFGDAWLEEFKDDKIGRSIIVCRTKEAQGVLESAVKAEALKLETVLPKKVIKSQIFNIYLRKKGLQPLISQKNRLGLKPSFSDRILSSVFLFNSVVGRKKVFRKILYFIPLSLISLYIKFLGKIWLFKAGQLFKKYI